ncbi:MAG: putative LPS assembly protein LptD [bacterium]
MSRSALTVVATMILLIVGRSVSAGDGDSLRVEHSDATEVQLLGHEYVVTLIGNVILKTGSGTIWCDSAEYRRGHNAWLRGRVVVEDTAYNLRADSVFYDVDNRITDAWGDNVELWSFTDSIYSVGPHAYYNRKSSYLFMDLRPTLYLRYPDSANMVEVIADTIEYTAQPRLATARGTANITSTDLRSTSQVAIMDMDSNLLELSGKPVAHHGNSKVTGERIRVGYEGDVLQSILVTDSARGEFKQAVDSTHTEFDESVLSGREIVFDFDRGKLTGIVCYGQAYSWYYPSSQGGSEYHENTVSGDTIRFLVRDQEKLDAVRVIGGAVGTYTHGRRSTVSGEPITADTVDYSSAYIEYALQDSIISLDRDAVIESGEISLSAHQVRFDTRQELIKAYSAETAGDSLPDINSFSYRAQPSNMPVVLLDGDEELLGDYLEYSLSTEKGRIVQSKTKYPPGLYYGGKLFREQENIFYIKDGCFTTCDQEEPHFHFRSSHLKLIQDDKLIARPVVAYLGRLPVFAIPYYVFPLKRGRHSGILPFQFGNFERDVRYVKDIGYYWAASEYWDWLGAVDYYDNDRTFTFKSMLKFRKRYLLTADMSGEYTTKTDFNRGIAKETSSKEYVLRGLYDHQVTPSFKIAGDGKYQSTSTYFQQYSNNLDERLNREVRSQLSITKKWGQSVSLSATANHTVNLDQESRFDKLPSATLSLPVLYPFGSGAKDDRSWYNDIKLTYSPSLVHESNRTTIDTGRVYYTNEAGDTTSVDTLSYRTRKQYAKIQHQPKLTLPTITLGSYLNLVPSIGYQETWFEIFRTDQSDSAGIDPTNYRTYSWDAGLSASTKLYGTVTPNILGLAGLRHVLTPSVSYQYRPDIDLHPEVRSYAGGGAGSTKSQTIGVGLGQDFMAKVKRGEDEKVVSLFSLSSSFGYDFEKDSLRFSDLTTTFRSDAIPNLHVDGTVNHSLYEPGTNNLDFLSPYKTGLSFNARLKLGGGFGLFDDAGSSDSEADSLAAMGKGKPKVGAGKKGRFDCSVEYRYAESGRGDQWRKTTDQLLVNINVHFNLTASTTVKFTEHFDVREGRVINNSVEINRTIHCWTGNLYWVPTGSTRGFGFKLHVTDLPEIKIDNGHDDYLGTLQNRYGGY